jgi:hypothetical protein
MTRFSRLIVVLVLGLFALTANGVAQNQLALNVVAAKLAESASGRGPGHIMPDGTFMADADMALADDDICHPGGTDTAPEGGHTHKGHADCVVCSLVATMGAFSQAAAVIVAFAKPDTNGAYHWASYSVALRVPHTPYASRAPPHNLAA